MYKYYMPSFRFLFSETQSAPSTCVTAAVLSQGLQLKWHLREFFFLASVAIITFITSATVLWRNVGSTNKAPVLTALSSGYLALLSFGIIRCGIAMPNHLHTGPLEC